MTGIEDAIVYVGAVVTAYVLARVSGPKREPAPVEKQCASTLSADNYASACRCNGMADPRCIGGQCTAHCRKHCHGECLK